MSASTATAERPLPISPFECGFVAEEPYRAGDYRRAIEIVSEALSEWPDHPTVHYQLACYRALAGDLELALEHLERACAGNPAMKEWARDDSDLDAIRNEPRFAATTA